MQKHDSENEEIENKGIYNSLLAYLENSDTNDNYSNFVFLISLIDKGQYKINKEEFFHFLQLLNCVSIEHYRGSHLIDKIKKIIQYYKGHITQTFSNNEIFCIFQNNKTILLFLFEIEILSVTETICKEIIHKIEPNGSRYCHFFYPEIKSFISEEKREEIEKELLRENPDIFSNFEQKRQQGENDSYICSLIRQDLVVEFVSYVSKSNYNLESIIDSSIFETNWFLIENSSTTLIEYSAFYGSIQIFQYLRMNGVDLKPSLWLYAIHSKNAELFHLLESININPPLNDYKICLIESIKCHHNDFANYIEDNLISQNEKEDLQIIVNIISAILESHNYYYFPSDFENEKEFYFLCIYKYYLLVDFYLKKKEESFEATIIFNINNLITLSSIF